MLRRVTMKEIAARTGLATSTICRALGTSAQIPDSTRAMVRAVAKEMGYRPDPLVSAFASRNRGKGTRGEITTIAYITNFPSAYEWRKNLFYRNAFDAASWRADELGYRVEHFWLKEKGMTGARLSRILYHRGIGAVCIAPTQQVRGHLSLDWRRFSCATIGYSLKRPDLHRAAPHHYHNVQRAVRELKKLGYRRIGFCSFQGTSKRVDDLWLAGWVVCEKFFPRLHMPYFLFNDDNRSTIADWCRKERLEAVLGVEPTILNELRKAKLYPGKVDYATMCWTDEEPEIAGIHQRPMVIGASAVDILVNCLQRDSRGIPPVTLTTLVEGFWNAGPSLRLGR